MSTINSACACLDVWVAVDRLPVLIDVACGVSHGVSILTKDDRAVIL